VPLGRDHHLTIHAAEVEALCLLESVQDAALIAVSDVAMRTELSFGPTHPRHCRRRPPTQQPGPSSRDRSLSSQSSRTSPNG
jgi:hypothetical protein